MSDDLDIRSGGVVAVDTDRLRAAAAGFECAAQEVSDAAHLAALAAAELDPVGGIARSARHALGEFSVRAATAHRHAVETADGLRAAAAVYEQAELGAQWASARLAGDHAAMRDIEDRRSELALTHPESTLGALGESLGHEFAWAGALVEELAAFAVLGPVALLLGGGGGAGAAGALLGGALPGIGRMPDTARLDGPAPRVRLEREQASSAVGAPASVAALAARVPSGEARVRVETYTMPGGHRQHVVYVAGTDTHRTTPWDAASNVQLATGQRSASYEATVEALRAAGVAPGEVVHAVGHSQGAMITARLALEGDVDVRTLVSFGSPVDVEAPTSTLSVVVRHVDDPVAALAASGYAETVGAPDSVVVQRDATSAPGTTIASHHMSAYRDTADLIDRSTDPRWESLRGLLDELGHAASVTAVEFSAQRVPTGRGDPVSSPSAAGAG
jgi:pimeloyl-ACP methyl ester carboxylesterase